MNDKWKINNDTVYAELEIESWLEFIELIEKDFINNEAYIYRGHRDSEWKLESTFDRIYRIAIERKKEDPKYIPNLKYEEFLKIHLENFRKNSIGRRLNPNKHLNENEWWALGQHYNLETPLLDWTQSPYIALFFALENSLIPKSNLRTLWIFNPLKLKEITINQRPEFATINEINSPIDENLRLLSQLGKFTKTPSGSSIEEFIADNIKLTGYKPVLYRINIPENLRNSILKHLNSMNINHSSIFPDLIGTSGKTNRELEILLFKTYYEKSGEFISKLLDYDLVHE